MGVRKGFLTHWGHVQSLQMPQKDPDCLQTEIGSSISALLMVSSMEIILRCVYPPLQSKVAGIRDIQSRANSGNDYCTQGTVKSLDIC